MNVNDNTLPKRLRSILQCDLIIDGSIKGECILEIDGKIVGNIDVDTVVVTNNGVIVGDIRTRNLMVFGQVTGSVDGEALALKETANLNAERIECASVSIEAGAWVTALSVYVKTPAESK